MSGKATASYVAFRAIRRFGGVFGVFSPRGRCVEREKCRVGLVLHVLHGGREIPPRFDAWIVCVVCLMRYLLYKP
ncbi:hypothetical protein Taro_013230 [Colocasia esculenta]|uniref:Uncharacterized protein n=1 Tax=Colocasia esculenta TaxID=4460 RepID=A0A843UI48_COLES|nr:hypothetical protein [Colocasia esculenta]